MNALQRLRQHGQSFWLDNLTRGMLTSGELARRVAEEGLRGVTSNPAIFHGAISEGEEYDADIARFAAEGLDAHEVYERLTVADVQGACDVLRPVWEEAQGTDGFVSLEVSPHLAHDTEGTLTEARRLFEAVGRPNVLIKIPGTEAGVPAVRQALFEGINVNITLLFSRDAYEAVATAHLDALEHRRDAGRAVDEVASVASFFLSRIDTETDARLDALAEAGDEDTEAHARALRGQAAIANAKLAYRSFDARLAGERWSSLEADGARPQRMLWASTSTKDPAYPDVKYVEPLIGPWTINTMPESTAQAFLDHGEVGDTVRHGVDEAERVMRELGEVGVDFDDVTRTLLDEGVDKFIAPYDKLLESLEDRIGALMAGSAS